MDFTELYKQQLLKFSPDSTKVATIVDHRLVIRDAESMQILSLFNNPSAATYLEWSADSQLVLCACYSTSKWAKGGRAWIRCYRYLDGMPLLSDNNENVAVSDGDEWSASIDEGIAGMVKCRFSPDGRHILSWSDYQLKLTIWPLIVSSSGQSAHYVKYPKSDRCFDFRPDGRYFAYCERAEGNKDFVGVVDMQSLTMVKHFALQTTNAESLHWSPDGAYLALVENALEYRVLIYTPVGHLVHSITSAGLPSKSGLLGVRMAQWSPSSHFLALMSAQEPAVTLINNLTWSAVIDFSAPRNVTDDSVAVYQEYSTSLNSVDKVSPTGGQIRFQSQYKLVSLPFQMMPESKDSLVQPLMEWSADGMFLAVWFQELPSHVIIYDMKQVRITAIIHQMSPVKSLEWNPIVGDGLIISCTDSCQVYLWSLDGCSSIQVPASNFQIQSVKWNSNGQSVAVMDKDRFCVAFPIASQ